MVTMTMVMITAIVIIGSIGGGAAAFAAAAGITTLGHGPHAVACQWCVKEQGTGSPWPSSYEALLYNYRPPRGNLFGQVLPIKRRILRCMAITLQA